MAAGETRGSAPDRAELDWDLCGQITKSTCLSGLALEGIVSSSRHVIGCELDDVDLGQLAR